ncbi:hypothetical protein BCAR13_60204 [Paraburkholderia caribensis]|nr:hypothetical protein BCAR13_60204 [Paraburkholderia caribensis]
MRSLQYGQAVETVACSATSRERPEFFVLIDARRGEPLYRKNERCRSSTSDTPLGQAIVHAELAPEVSEGAGVLTRYPSIRGHR